MKNKTQQKITYFISALCLISLAGQGFAINNDKQKSVKITAKMAECQEESLLCIYTGDAKFEQGDSFLNAPKISVYQNNTHRVEKILALGKPAHYHTTLKQNENPVSATANTIEIYPQKKIMILSGKAELQQKQNTFKGEHIEVDIQKKTILSLPAKNSLTTIFIQPE
jgi:lipopolysaccharide export system protein LptA